MPASPPKKISPSRFDNFGMHILVLVILTVIVYANSLQGKFVFDDQQIVLQNPRLMNVHTLSDAFDNWRRLAAAVIFDVRAELLPERARYLQLSPC